MIDFVLYTLSYINIFFTACLIGIKNSLVTNTIRFLCRVRMRGGGIHFTYTPAQVSVVAALLAPILYAEY
jgi:hypothetical protein